MSALELQHALRQAGHPTTQEQMRILMGSADKNKDGVLTREEVGTVAPCAHANACHGRARALSHHTRVPMPSPRGLPAVPCGDARQMTGARLKGRRR